MSKGLSYAFYLIDKNSKLPTDKLLGILKPYNEEIKFLGGFSECGIFITK